MLSGKTADAPRDIISVHCKHWQ